MPAVYRIQEHRGGGVQDLARVTPGRVVRVVVRTVAQQGLPRPSGNVARTCSAW